MQLLKQTLIYQIIIFIVFANFVFGQDKVRIDQNIVKYESKDEYNRFDNIAIKQKKYRCFDLEINKNSNIKILNEYSTGFTGRTIYFLIDKNLNIIQSYYDYWTDNIEIGVKYKVLDIDFRLNQNPFKETDGLQGQYEMKVKKVNKAGETLKQIIFKGKFKSFEGIDESSSEYLWALKQNKILNGIIDKDGVYLHPNKMASLKSDYKVLIEKIKKIKGYKPEKIKARCVINKKGKIEPNSIKYTDYINYKTKKKIDSLLVKFTQWYPACINEKEVKSKIPIIIVIE